MVTYSAKLQISPLAVDKKASTKKRTGEAGAGPDPENSAKKPRLETVPDTSTTGGSTSLSYSVPGQSYFPPGSGSPGGLASPCISRLWPASNRFANQQ